jgi:hypothetical protein
VNYYLSKFRDIIDYEVEKVKGENYDLVILDFSKEGNSNYSYDNIIEKVKESQTLNKIKTIAISQNPQSCDFKNIFYYNFAWEVFKDPIKVVRKYNYKYKFNYLGGYPRKDKILFFNELNKFCNLSQGIYSIASIPKDLIQYATEETLNLTPKVIDHDMLYSKSNGDFWKKIKFNIYNKSRFSIIQETEMESLSSRYTEKTIKACIMKTPFLIAGNKGVLQQLRKDGFETYRRIFNEDYDLIDDPQQRSTAIAKEANRLMSMSDSQWADLEKTFLSRVANHNAYNVTQMKRKEDFISSLKF